MRREQNQRTANKMKTRIVKYKATFFKQDGDKEHYLGALTFLQVKNDEESLIGRAFRLASQQQLEANRIKIEEVKD